MQLTHRDALVQYLKHRLESGGVRYRDDIDCALHDDDVVVNVVADLNGTSAEMAEDVAARAGRQLRAAIPGAYIQQLDVCLMVEDDASSDQPFYWKVITTFHIDPPRAADIALATTLARSV